MLGFLSVEGTLIGLGVAFAFFLWHFRHELFRRKV